jgi:hypothetical protein
VVLHELQQARRKAIDSRSRSVVENASRDLGISYEIGLATEAVPEQDVSQGVADHDGRLGVEVGKPSLCLAKETEIGFSAAT